jgi:glucose-1-phosphate adenylyltransferase
MEIRIILGVVLAVTARGIASVTPSAMPPGSSAHRGRTILLRGRLPAQTVNTEITMDVERDEPRFVSRLTRETLALVLAGGRGSRLYELTEWRAKPAVPFGGKFRIIDFPLSNCVNSGIRHIGVLTQYKAHSLVRHLTLGWSNFQSELGEFVEILPASQRTSDEWYAGTADALYQNLDIIRTHKPKWT